MPTRMTLRARIRAFASAAATVLVTAGCATGASRTDGGNDMPSTTMGRATVTEMTASWPAKQRETIALMTRKYGQPTVMGDRMVAWFGNGPFVTTSIARDDIAHNFPMAHVDYLTQTVKHRVPADRLDDLFEYDGSVYYHRTRGELSAQCDVEEMNWLALNLAHDVIMGTRTPADARAFYGKTAMAFKAGDKSSPYVQGLMFQVEPTAADPDRPLPM